MLKSKPATNISYDQGENDHDEAGKQICHDQGDDVHDDDDDGARNMVNLWLSGGLWKHDCVRLLKFLPNPRYKSVCPP